MERKADLAPIAIEVVGLPGILAASLGAIGKQAEEGAVVAVVGNGHGA